MRTCVAVAFEAEKRPEKVEVDVTAEAGERPVEIMAGEDFGEPFCRDFCAGYLIR